LQLLLLLHASSSSSSSSSHSLILNVPAKTSPAPTAKRAAAPILLSLLNYAYQQHQQQELIYNKLEDLSPH
jgi:hypothetical protein